MKFFGSFAWIAMVLACSSHDFSPPNHGTSEVNIADAGATDHASKRPHAETAVDSDDQKVNEPVPVAGSFLSCQYPAGQMQNAENMQLSCQLENINYMPMEVDAKFSKLGEDGSKHPLSIVSFDPELWRWVLTEDIASLSLTTLLVEMSIDGQGPFMFSDDLDDPVVFTLFSGYWLTSEPNNDAGIENCVEMLSQAGQTNHRNFTGLNSGPLQRFNDVPCTIQRNFLCQAIAPALEPWVISSNMGRFNDAATACPQDYRVGVPHTAQEIMEVNAIIDATPGLLAVWVAIQRKPDELDVFQWLF